MHRNSFIQSPTSNEISNVACLAIQNLILKVDFFFAFEVVDLVLFLGRLAWCIKINFGCQINLERRLPFRLTRSANTSIKRQEFFLVCYLLGSEAF